MGPHLSRRSFLIGAATAAGALGVAACTKSNGVINVGGPDATANLSLLLTSGAVDGPGNDSEVSVFEAGMAQRVAFVLTGTSGFLAPKPGTTVLRAGTDDKHWGEAIPLVVHGDTGASATTYLVGTYVFPQAGMYWFRSYYGGQTADSPVAVIDPKQAQIPYAGQKMISTPTPTVSDGRGVNPICTRAPMCPFHTQSLDVALTQNLPVALIFATPKLCETATCGPVLDTVVAAAPAYDGKINFVHSEIFVNDTSHDVPNTPAVLAYHLQSEPLMFLAKADGTVVERIDGLFGKAEVTAALDRLAATT